MVPYRDLGLGFLIARHGHVADILDGHVAFEGVDLGVDVHRHQPVGIDQRRHIELDTDLKLLDEEYPP